MGKISRIQLRGISRTPSDRLTEDGGCAESLNVQLDNTELAPSFIPEDVTKKLGLPEDLQAEKVFVHKTTNYTHYLIQHETRVAAYAGGKVFGLLSLQDGEEMSAINSVGNIVIIATTQSVYYNLWKNDQYVYIGSQLPVPVIQIDVVGRDDEIFNSKNTGTIRLDTTGEVAGRMGISSFDKTTWGVAARGGSETEEENNYLQQVNSDLWTAIQKRKSKIGKWGFFSCPRFVRYAVKLYDGSYVYHSVPILIGAGSKEWVSATGSFVNPGTLAVSSISFYIRLYYRAIAKLVSWDVSEWTDIIQGVDIFISTDIAFPKINTSFDTCDDGGGKIYFKGYDKPYDITKEEILSKVNFYKIESIPVGDLSEIKKGIDLHRRDFVEEETTLVLQERLTTDYMASHKVVPRTMSIFNNSLLINAGKIEFPAPFPLLNGLFCDAKLLDLDWEDYQTPSTYQIKFYMRRNNGEEYSVMARNPQGGFDLVTPLVSNGAPAGVEVHWYARPMAWLAYPDVNCYKADIYLGDGEAMSIEMHQHPGLNIAYAFVGLDVYLEDYGQVSGDASYDYSERKSYEVNNQVMLSEANNPFVFPADKRNSFQSKVLGVAIATTALSQGQFGQFPLYVFTEDGIWAMETAADGSFVTSKPLSRDVCVNPKSITSIDNAVVFVSAQGVMLLQGSQVTNISPYMNGKHYVVENTAQSIIEGQDFFCDLLPAISDKTHFLAFVKEASVAYDYAGKRLVFIKDDETYQYVYKLDTQTWHKVAYGINMQAAVNSYPECLVQGAEDKVIERVLWTTEESYTQEETDYLAGRIRVILPHLSDQEIESFLSGYGYIDVTSVSDADREWLYNEMEYYHVTTSFSEKTESVKSTRIYDLSTLLDAQESMTPTRGIIATRPFDLGEPDILKTITDIRVRGQFPKGAVKFILLGSNDGVNFYTLSTLRGKSWKLFRMILLADLAPTDRISWVDIMYETKFTNRLR